MGVNKKASKIYKFVEVRFVETVFVFSIISSQVITESKIMLPTYLTF